MTSFLLMDGYVHARSIDVEDSIIAPEIQTVSEYYTILPDLTGNTPALLPQFDLASDDSFQKYLSDATPFTDPDYVPADLIPINSNFTANDARKFKLRQEAGDEFADMARHFRNTFSGDRISIINSYRSKGFQGFLLKNCRLANLCAKVGTSEHQAGLALDLTVVTKGGRTVHLEGTNKYTEWLHAHAYQWGFHNTYQKGVEIDGKIVEGWHRRYLGTGLATILFENNQTLAEYYKTVNN
ncbi:MAG: D-alanyl-D-alanine carboxypeptidase family protein [Candidatus Absconditabacterales bacterium]